jgi:hypothetical protein
MNGKKRRRYFIHERRFRWRCATPTAFLVMAYTFITFAEDVGLI